MARRMTLPRKVVMLVVVVVVATTMMAVVLGSEATTAGASATAAAATATAAVAAPNAVEITTNSTTGWQLISSSAFSNSARVYGFGMLVMGTGNSYALYLTNGAVCTATGGTPPVDAFPSDEVMTSQNLFVSPYFTQPVDSGGWGGRKYATCTTYKGVGFCAGGTSAGDPDSDDNNFVYGGILASTDGQSWGNPAGTNTIGQRYMTALVAHSDGILYCLGGGGTGLEDLNDVWATTSTSGGNWQKLPAAPWSGRRGHAAVSFNGNIIVIAGMAGYHGTLLNDIWTSPDAKTWTQAHASYTPSATPAGWFMPRYGHSVVEYHNYLYMSGGYGYASGAATIMSAFSDLWRSTDGVTWNIVQSVAEWQQHNVISGYRAGRTGHSMVVFGTNLFLMGGAVEVFDHTGPTKIEQVYGDLWMATPQLDCLVNNKVCNGIGTCDISAPPAVCRCFQPNVGGHFCEACAPAYYGPTCTKCAVTSTVSGQTVVCNGHGTCNGGGTTSGNGLCTCEAAWAAPNCNTCAGNRAGASCQLCLPNYYGPTCSGVCPTCSGRGWCNGNGTQAGTGVCECVGHYGGSNCQGCATGWTGPTCNTCATGFTGPNCDQCATGYWGPSCSPCPNCNGHGTCDGSGTTGGTGKCDCATGWNPATNCNSCAQNYAGASCNSCATGWTGSTCQNCATGYYGPSCQPCTDCNGNGQCSGSGTHSGDGTCTCNVGWSQPTCSSCLSNYAGATCNTCADGFFGPECKACNCSSHGVCDGSGTMSGTGKCTSCNTGYQGSMCTQCTTSYVSVSGTCMACPQASSQVCNGHGTCVASTSQNAAICSCTPPFTGTSCTSEGSGSSTGSHTGSQTGSHSGTTPTSGGSPGSSGFPTAAIGGIAAAVVVLVGAGLYWRYRRNARKSAFTDQEMQAPLVIGGDGPGAPGGYMPPIASQQTFSNGSNPPIYAAVGGPGSRGTVFMGADGFQGAAPAAPYGVVQPQGYMSPTPTAPKQYGVVAGAGPATGSASAYPPTNAGSAGGVIGFAPPAGGAPAAPTAAAPAPAPAAAKPPVTMSTGTHIHEIKWEELEDPKKLGQGSFGVVHKAYWRGTKVAIKIPMSQDEEIEDEARLLARVSNHPHVLSVIGMCYHPFKALVVPFMESGSVEDMLVIHGPKNKRTVLPWRTAVQMFAEAAAGMLHLHHEHVVHRDLACRNLLVDAHYHVVVADFGMARLKDASRSAGSTITLTGPIKWEAPECFGRNKVFSEATDVFSFGVSLYEVCAGSEPWPGMDVQAVGRAVLAGQRMPIPKGDAVVLQLMQDCWAQQPADRPTFLQIVQRLRRHLESSDVPVGTVADVTGVTGLS